MSVSIDLFPGLDLEAFEGRPCSLSSPWCLKELVEPRQELGTRCMNNGAEPSKSLVSRRLQASHHRQSRDAHVQRKASAL